MGTRSGHVDGLKPADRWGPVIGCVGAFAVVLLFKGIVPADTDTPWHLAQGRLLLRRWASGDLGVDGADTFSWTARGVPWHSNAWGFDAALAGTYDVGGWIAVAGLRFLLLAALVALAWAVTRHGGAGRWARAGSVWVAALLVVPSGAMRPQLVSFVMLLACLELTGLALDGGGPERAGGGRPAWRSSSLPPLVALAATVSLWAALHGAVVAGVVAVVATCAGEVVDRRALRLPALTASVATLASCLSPLGVRVWSYALETSGASAQERIQEWQPPSLGRGQDVVISGVLLVMAASALALPSAATGRRRWRLLAPALLLTLLAFQAVRNEPFALLALLPFTTRALSAAGAWLERRGRALPVHPGRALGAMTVGALLGGSIQAGSLPFHPDPLGSSEYPQVATALPSGCRLLNEYDFGGYLILVRPDVLVSQDGRNDLYGPRRLEDQERLLGEGDPDRAVAWLERLGVTCILLRSERGLASALRDGIGWRQVGGRDDVEAWVRQR